MKKDISCIYCKQERKFNIEHVFPKSLGGDDKRYLLKEGVCECCNSKYSGLEAKLARESAIGIARLHMHKKRPPYANPKIIPKLNLTATTTVSSSEYLLDVEASHLRIEGRLLPQIIIDGLYWEKYIPEGYVESDFFDDLLDMLAKEQIYIIQKSRSDKRYFVTAYKFDGRKYIFTQGKNLSKPPKNSFWIEVFVRPTDLSAPYPPRIIKRSGKLSIRAERGEVIDLSVLLTEARKMIPSLSRQPAPRYAWDSEVAYFQPPPGQEQIYLMKNEEDNLKGLTEIANKTDKSGYNFQGKSRFTIGDYQIFTKIAFNFLAFESGTEYVRNKRFDGVRKFAIDGLGENKIVVDIGNYFEVFGKNPPTDSHLIVIVWEFTAYTTCNIICSIQFYGFFNVTVSLGLNVPIPDMPQETYFSVGYFTNNITRYSKDEYFQNFF